MNFVINALFSNMMKPYQKSIKSSWKWLIGRNPNNIMKLLILMPSSEIGGVERTTWNIVKNIKCEEISLLTNKAVSDFYSDTPCKVFLYEDLGISEHTLVFSSIYSNARAIKKVVFENQIDSVLAIKQFTPIYACFAKDFLSMKANVIISYRGNLSAFFSLNKNFGILPRLLVRYSLKSAHGSIVSTHGVKDDLVKNFGAKGSKFRVIPNGIDIERIRKLSQEHLGMKKNCPWIITSCRLDPMQKDILTLLKAFKNVRNHLESTLIIVGDGPQRRQIISWINEMNLENDVIVLGFQKNPFKYIAKADVFVLSSLVEGFGNVIIEAMALGIPVISTDCPSGPAEIIEHGVNGMLVPMKDHNKMAEYILNVLSNSELRQNLSKSGIIRSEDFSALKMSQSYEEYLSGIKTLA